MLIDKNLCKAIKKLRLDNELKPKDFAESIGVTMDAIYKIEAFKRNPSIDLLLRIKQVYGLKLSILD